MVEGQRASKASTRRPLSEMLRSAAGTKRGNLLLGLLVIQLLGWGCSGDNNAAPLARHGVIDLSRLDMTRLDPVRLDGEWEFYWKQLLSSRDFEGSKAASPTGFLTLPGSWSRFEFNGEKLGGEGYATFRLRILPGPGRQSLALQIGLVNSAYRLWANDRLLIENGVLGKSAREETPIQSFQQVRLQIEGRPIELVLQISNYHDREGGVVSSLRLGPADKLEAQAA